MTSTPVATPVASPTHSTPPFRAVCVDLWRRVGGRVGFFRARSSLGTAPSSREKFSGASRAIVNDRLKNTALALLKGLSARLSRDSCELCRGPLPPYRGRGPHRKRCEACTRDRAGVSAAWRAAHPEAVASRNEARRAPVAARPCAECGSEFVSRRRDRRYCSPLCKSRRDGRAAAERSSRNVDR